MNNGMKGFTLIELIVSIAIFAFMTALVMSKYGSFNQNTLLTNMAYDMAITIRTAQSYGLSVKSADASNNIFSAPYGIHFDMSNSNNDKFILFADKNPDYRYNANSTDDEAITKYTLNSGVKIASICLGSSLNDCGVSNNLLGPGDKIDIRYKRPNPDAMFDCNGSAGGVCQVNNIASPTYNLNPEPVAIITLTSSDGNNREYVFVRRNGQISVGLRN